MKYESIKNLFLFKRETLIMILANSIALLRILRDIFFVTGVISIIVIVITFYFTTTVKYEFDWCVHKSNKSEWVKNEL